MKLFLSCLRLVRPLNLVIIVFTLYMVRLFFMVSDKLSPEVSRVTYALFALAFVFMAAGGYIINDYYDIEIDRVNRPGKVIIGNQISPRSALIAYWILSIGSILTGFWSCYAAGVHYLWTLFLFYMVGLWFYSYKLKSTFLFGNLLIALFIALVPLAGTRLELCTNALLDHNQKFIIWELMGGISLFAFLSTLIREIIKDIEDMEGDKLAGCRTMPIVIGIGKIKWVVFILIMLFNAILGYVQYQIMFLGMYPLIYFLLFIEAPFIIILYQIKKATAPKDFHSMSNWLKILMLTGIIYVFGVAYEGYSIYLFFNSLFNK